MDFHRAQEIVNSEDTIEVLLNNKPVWINNLDPKGNTAEVTDSEKNSISVPIDELKED